MNRLAAIIVVIACHESSCYQCFIGHMFLEHRGIVELLCIPSRLTMAFFIAVATDLFSYTPGATWPDKCQPSCPEGGETGLGNHTDHQHAWEMEVMAERASANCDSINEAEEKGSKTLQEGHTLSPSIISIYIYERVYIYASPYIHLPI